MISQNRRQKCEDALIAKKILNSRVASSLEPHCRYDLEAMAKGESFGRFYHWQVSFRKDRASVTLIFSRSEEADAVRVAKVNWSALGSVRSEEAATHLEFMHHVAKLGNRIVAALDRKRAKCN